MLDVGAMQRRDGEWLDGAGMPINVDRALQAAARQDAVRQMKARLLGSAVGEEGTETRWFVLRVDGHKLQAVDKCLTDAGVITFLPMKKVQMLVSRTRRVQRHVERPVWPGLLFVKVVPSPNAWTGLAMVDGVKALMKPPGREHPVALRDKEVQAVKGLVEAGAFNQKKGDLLGHTVMVKAGPFAEMQGVVDGYVGKRHVRVLAWLFGGQVPVEVPLAKVTKAD